MVRSRLILAVVGVLCASGVEAQQMITGMAAVSVGAAQGGDIGERSLSPSGTLTVVESNGIGAEIDLGHTLDFAGDGFADSGVTSAMIHVIGMWPHPVFRPFGSAGVGLMRMRASLVEGQPILSRTDTAFDVGGGAVAIFNETIGVRGDIRYFRYFQRQIDVPLNTNGFAGFWRTSLGVVFSWPIR